MSNVVQNTELLLKEGEEVSLGSPIFRIKTPVDHPKNIRGGDRLEVMPPGAVFIVYAGGYTKMFLNDFMRERYGEYVTIATVTPSRS